MCSGITCGRVLNGELYAQRFHKLIYLHLSTDYCMKLFPQSSELIQLCTEKVLLSVLFPTIEEKSS